MRTPYTLALSLAALMILSAAAHAQTPTPMGGGRSWHLGLGGGMSVPAGDLDQALDDGVHGQLFVSWQPPGMATGLRASVGYERFDLKESTASFGLDAGTGTVLSGLANLSFGIPLGPVTPYLTFGLGAFQFDSEATSESDVHFGINGGAGVQLRLGPIQAFVEGRLENVFTEQGLDESLADSEDFKSRIIPVTFGIVI